MKTEKLIQSLSSSGSSSRTNSLIALIAGLAGGAVLSVLFAPESGASARQKICDAVTGLFGGSAEEETDPAPENQTQNRPGVKKPKSDIKSLIHQSHVQAVHTEQGI